MFRTVCRRKLAVPVVLCLTLLAPLSAEALPLESPAEPFAAVMSHLAEWLTLLLGDVGCSWDPDGRCHGSTVIQPPTSGLTPDVGCSWDPDGGACADHG